MQRSLLGMGWGESSQRRTWYVPKARYLIQKITEWILC